MYENFVDNNYELWCKKILAISIEGTPANASTFSWWYLGVTNPDKTELNIGEYELHEWNVSTTRWRNYLDSLIINQMDFDGYPIVYPNS